jgi:DNA-binding MarR family transcriptional regulator
MEIGSDALSQWEKEQIKKYQTRYLGKEKIGEIGQYRVYFTRKTLKNDLANLDYKERLVRLVFELFRNKKTNLAWPSLSELIELTGMSKKTLLKTLKSLEAKKIFQIERRKGDNNLYRFS